MSGRKRGGHNTTEPHVHERDNSLHGPPIWDDRTITVADLTWDETDPLLEQLRKIHPEHDPRLRH